LEIARAAQAKDGKMSVVFVTARHDILNRLRGSGIVGAALPKPFDLDDFLQVVQDFVGPAGSDPSIKQLHSSRLSL
jgi:DNA-binding response OmpR family regulator